MTSDHLGFLAAATDEGVKATDIATVFVAGFALLVSIWAATNSHMTNVTQSKQLHVARFQALRHQASQVALWTIGSRVVYVNSSNLPVFNIYIKIPAGGIIHTQILEPTTEPTEFARLTPDGLTPREEDEGRTSDHRRSAITFEFRDAEGNVWRRYSSGGLTLLRESENLPKKKEDASTIEEEFNLLKLNAEGLIDDD